MSKIITISVDEVAERKFRKVAMVRYGNRKGSLGKALTEAMRYWTEQKSYDPNEHALMLMETGFKMGKLKFKHRSELYDR